MSLRQGEAIKECIVYFFLYQHEDFRSNVVLMIQLDTRQWRIVLRRWSEMKGEKTIIAKLGYIYRLEYGYIL